jgi:2-oxoglutarate ferredoxin oxidoreductase subunit beta
MVYGLTKGQASPTSQIGFKTPVQVDGVFLEPLNPMAVAVALDAGFVARAFAGDTEQTKQILIKAVGHKGYALVDILQPCASFNRLNTYQWFKDNSYYLEDSYDPGSRNEAFKRATEKERLPLGVFYVNPDKETFEQNLGVYRADRRPLYEREPDVGKVRDLLRKFKIAD